MANQRSDDDDESNEDELRKTRKKRRAAARASHSYDPRPPKTEGQRWTSRQLLVALVFGAAVGCLGFYSARGGHEPDATTTAPTDSTLGPRVNPSAAAPAAGTLDKFGRAPGDEHHGHDHPPQKGAAPAAPAAPAPGPDGKDSFGRAAGDQHFGHNHP